MRVEIAAVLGLAVGAAGTYAALASRPPKTVVVEVAGPTVETPTPAGLRSAEGGAVASGRAPADPVGSGVFALDLRAWPALDVVKEEKDENVKSLWRTIGRVYARAGLLDDWLRLADAALAADAANGAGVLWLATEFPEPRRLVALEALLKAHPDLGTRVHPLTRGQAYLKCGSKEKGFPLVRESVVSTKGEYVGPIESLVEADAERADAELWGVASDWSVNALGNVAAHLASHARADLAKRWLELIARKKGPGPTAAEVAARTAESVREAEAATREAPEEESNWAALAEARNDAGDKKGAFDAYAKAIETGGYEGSYFEAMVSLDAARALPILERAVKEDGGDDFLRELMLAYLRLGRGREGAETYFRMREPDEDEHLAHELAALAPEAALAAVERRAKRRGGPLDVDYDVRGAALLALGQPDRAFEAYRREAEVNRSLIAWVGIARADATRAVPILEEVSHKGALDEGYRIAMADAYRRVGRKEEAAALCEAVLAEDGEDFNALREFALVYPEKGVPRLKAACEADADGWYGWVSLGDAFRELGKPVEARAAYERAIAAGGDARPILARLASLR